ncbi:family 20 glycosylhydrolase [Naasia lichenicola]|nr:family 20 glycosylhydrolase [Naasia lichenicola]
MPMIPAPAIDELRAGTPFPFSARVALTWTDAAIEPVARAFLRELHALAGISMDRASEFDAPRIELALTSDAGDADGLGQVPRPFGVSPLGDSGSDERHSIVIDSTVIAVTARSPEGIFRALTTLRQLIEEQLDDAGEAALAPRRIVDGPRIAWRGLSFDVVRTFFGPAEVRSVIDVLALYKLNVLHLHLTDNQGWRIEIASWPKLATVGGAGAVGDRPGGFFTQREYVDLVAYARARFVTIVPEIDVPGHTSAIFAAYPDLNTTEPELRSSRPDIVSDYLDPRGPRTFEFLADVLGEIAALTPTPYLHIGGDEPYGMPPELYREFVERATTIVRGLGKRVAGWQEIARSDLEPGDLIQYWIEPHEPETSPTPDGDADAASDTSPSSISDDIRATMEETFAQAGGDLGLARAQGAQIILSPSSIAYFDTPYAEPSAEHGQESARSRLGLRQYQPVSVERSFDWDPATIVPGLDLAEQLAGVEAAIWCETVQDLADLQFLLLPRIPGFAERAWSSPRSSWPEYVQRLAAHAPIWRRAGWNYFRSSLVDWR